MMLRGPMTAWFNWKHTRDDFAVGNKENRLDQNQGKQSTHMEQM